MTMSLVQTELYWCDLWASFFFLILLLPDSLLDTMGVEANNKFWWILNFVILLLCTHPLILHAFTNTKNTTPSQKDKNITWYDGL